MDDKTAIEDRVILSELESWRRIVADGTIDFELAPDHGAPPGTTQKQLGEAVFTRAIQAIETLAKVRELITSVPDGSYVAPTPIAEAWCAIHKLVKP